jgi:hypothetical protein
LGLIGGLASRWAAFTTENRDDSPRFRPKVPRPNEDSPLQRDISGAINPAKSLETVSLYECVNDVSNARKSVEKQ